MNKPSYWRDNEHPAEVILRTTLPDGRDIRLRLISGRAEQGLYRIDVLNEFHTKLYTLRRTSEDKE